MKAVHQEMKLADSSEPSCLNSKLTRSKEVVIADQREIKVVEPGDALVGERVTPGFSEGNQVQTYMHARIKFHTYSDI
jgi:hypothetical protein